MSEPTRIEIDSETMRAFEAEIERKAHLKAQEQKAETATEKPDELADTTPFGRKLKELGFDKL